MTTRQWAAKMRAAARAFRLAGGQHPHVVVTEKGFEIIEAPANSTNQEEAARTQALLDARLGGSSSEP